MNIEMQKGEFLGREKDRDWFTNVAFVLMFVIFASFFIFNATVSVSIVDGTSMNNTLDHKNTLLLQKYFRQINRGDIVIISGVSENMLVKRVIAVGGDKLVFKENEFVDNRVDLYISKDGKDYVRLDESGYIKEHMQKNNILGWDPGNRNKFYLGEYKLAPKTKSAYEFDQYAIQIADGEFFFMGDNRNDSSDSRFYGACERSNIEGKYFYTVKKNSTMEKILLFLYREKA